MKPADVPDLPEHGIDDRQHWPHQLLGRQVFGETARAGAYIAELTSQLTCGCAARRTVSEGFVHEGRYYHTGPFVVTVR